MTLRTLGTVLCQYLRTARAAGAVLLQGISDAGMRRAFILSSGRRRPDAPPNLPASWLELVGAVDAAATRTRAAARAHIDRRVHSSSHADRALCRAVVVGDKSTFLDTLAGLTGNPNFQTAADRSVDEILVVEGVNADPRTRSEASVAIDAIRHCTARRLAGERHEDLSPRGQTQPASIHWRS